MNILTPSNTSMAPQNCSSLTGQSVSFKNNKKYCNFTISRKKAMNKLSENSRNYSQMKKQKRKNSKNWASNTPTQGL
jgi:hypothetical protein